MVKRLSSQKPYCIVMIGTPGVGKTQFAARFSETFSAPLVSVEMLKNAIFPDTDVSREELQLLSGAASIQLSEVLKSGSTCIIDGLGDTKTNRLDIKKQAHTHGYSTLYVWVQTDQPTAKQRATRPSRSSEKTAISEELYTVLHKRFTAPHTDEKPVVISGKHTYATQLKVVLKRLVEPRTDSARPREEERPNTRPGRNIIIR